MSDPFPHLAVSLDLGTAIIGGMRRPLRFLLALLPFLLASSAARSRRREERREP